LAYSPPTSNVVDISIIPTIFPASILRSRRYRIIDPTLCHISGERCADLFWSTQRQERKAYQCGKDDSFESSPSGLTTPTSRGLI
jgi:hypothetical protein